MLKHVPNILSICRLLLIPVIVISVVTSNYLLAIIVFTISSLTDIVDGYIARNFDAVTNVGKLLDPLADKLTQLSMIASLVWTNVISGWILTVLLTKEFIMIAGASFLYGKSVVVYSKWYGKLATVLLYLSIMVSLLFKQFNVTSAIWINISTSLYIITLAMTVFALLLYCKALHNKGFIDKSDLNKEIIIDKKK
jgi:cardiolipin synthase